MRYLEIQFHDNDFASDIMSSLQKLWKIIVQDYKDHEHYKIRRKPIDSFLYLHKVGLLNTMIEKLVVLSAMSHDVGWAALGIYNKDHDVIIDRKKIESVITQAEHFEKYFKGMGIVFHDDLEFSKTWENAEHAWLDIETGDVGCF